MNKRFDGDVGDYKSSYLECREQHDWRPVTDWKLVWDASHERLLEFTRVKECKRCKQLVSKKYYGATGRVIPGSERRNYPDQYLTTKGNRIDAGMSRLEQLRRANLIPRNLGG